MIAGRSICFFPRNLNDEWLNYSGPIIDLIVLHLNPTTITTQIFFSVAGNNLAELSTQKNNLVLVYTSNNVKQYWWKPTGFCLLVELVPAIAPWLSVRT